MAARARADNGAMTKSELSNRYTELREGGWGVWVNGRVPEPGDVIEVMKASGEVTSEIIKGVLWHDGRRAICSIHSSSKD